MCMVKRAHRINKQSMLEDVVIMFNRTAREGITRKVHLRNAVRLSRE